MEMVNGYVFVDLLGVNVYKKALGAIRSGKPIMVLDAPNVYFADTFKTDVVDGDNVVIITKGGKTITINDNNSVTSEGEIQPSSEGGSSVYVCDFLSDNTEVTLTDEQKNELVSKLNDPNIIIKFAQIDATFNVLVYSVSYGIDAGTGDIDTYYMWCYFNGNLYGVSLNINTNKLQTETP